MQYSTNRPPPDDATHFDVADSYVVTLGASLSFSNDRQVASTSGCEAQIGEPSYLRYDGAPARREGFPLLGRRQSYGTVGSACEWNDWKPTSRASAGNGVAAHFASASFPRRPAFVAMAVTF